MNALLVFADGHVEAMAVPDRAIRARMLEMAPRATSMPRVDLVGFDLHGFTVRAQRFSLRDIIAKQQHGEVIELAIFDEDTTT